jgi:uncharacterized membrane protein (DUF4010 family)
MEQYEPLLAMATALAVGLLIGLEREQTRTEGGTLFAGVRTYPIFAMIGALAAMQESPWLPLVALAGVIALCAMSYATELRETKHRGVTTEASVIATYLLGALATSRGVIEPLSNRLLLVGALGVALAYLLSAKQYLHGIASRVSRDDLYATMKFLIVAVIVVPVLPRHEMGPLDAIEPFVVGLMVVTISGLSFVGYLAMRWLGPSRGLLASAAFGGLVSSTAVSVSMAARTKQNAALAPVAATAIGIAGAIMISRVAVLVAVVDAPLLARLAIPLAAAAAGSAIAAWIVYRKPDGATAELEVKNPFELGTAIRFGLVFAAILLATKAAKVYLGDRGLIAAGAIAGTTDVDALTLSTARLARDSIEADIAAITILVAAGVNTIVKTGIAWTLGGARLGRRAALIGAASIACGALAFVLS